MYCGTAFHFVEVVSALAFCASDCGFNPHRAKFFFEKVCPPVGIEPALWRVKISSLAQFAKAMNGQRGKINFYYERVEYGIKNGRENEWLVSPRIVYDAGKQK